MRRYALPVELPFELEPYRILIGLAIILWTLSLLAQPDVALRRSGLEGPVLRLLSSLLVASDFANPGRAAEMQSYVIRGADLGAERCRCLLLRGQRRPHVLASTDHPEAPCHGLVCSRGAGDDRVQNGMVSVPASRPRPVVATDGLVHRGNAGDYTHGASGPPSIQLRSVRSS